MLRCLRRWLSHGRTCFGIGRAWAWYSEPMPAQARRGARHNGGCREPEGREAKRSGAAPSALCARLRHFMATARYVECDSIHPAATAKHGRAQCPAGLVFVVLRAAPGLMGGGAPTTLPAARGLPCASRVTPALSVASAHPSSAAPQGVRCNVAGLVFFAAFIIKRHQKRRCGVQRAVLRCWAALGGSDGSSARYRSR